MAGRATAWAWCLAVGLAGCQGVDDVAKDTDDADLVGDTDVVVTVQSFCERLSTEICEGLSSCDCRFDVRPYSAETCVAARTEECATFLADAVQADLDAGRATLDPGHVTRCVAGVRAMADACSLLRTGGLPDACSAAIADAAALSEPCVAQGFGAVFCANGAGLCAHSETATMCVARPVEGEDCPEGVCAEDLRCGSISGKCLAPGGQGEACLEPADCVEGLVCAAGGTCDAPIPLGARCDDDTQCDDGLSCDGGTCAEAVPLDGGCYNPGECGASRSCGRAPESRTCGAPDTVDQDCREGTCGDGLLCASASQTCEVLPGADEACLDGFACDAGLTCADGLGVCAVLPGLGETCAVGSRFCEDGLGCDFDTNTCQPPAGEGEACLLNPPDYLCADGLGCDFGAMGSVCVAISGVGSDCNSDRTCEADTFCDFRTLKCADRFADGAACSAGNECAADSTCSPQPEGYVCTPIPARGGECVDVCEEGSVCKGPGGQCVPTFCVID